MERRVWGDEDERDPDLTRFRDEASSKNAVRNRLRIDRIDLPPDRLAGVVSCGRDFFHTFVSGTLGRRYKRPPIYLVDSWVVGALGAFMDRGQRRLPGSLPTSNDPYGSDVIGLGPALALFRALHKVQELLRGVRILRIGGAGDGLEAQCLAIIEGTGKVSDLAHVVGQLGELVDRATTSLQRDLFVGPHVEPAVAGELGEAIRVLVRAAEAASRSPLPELPGTGFAPDRASGVLFGSIPELDIVGPAILLAPARIISWASRFKALEDVSRGIAPESMEAWFGVRDPTQRAGAIGIVNVLHHEMTHAMVGLPTDPVEDADQLFQQHWSFYDKHPEFEEGFCDATAAISTGIALLKATFDIKGRGLPRLHEGRYAAEWGRVFRALAPTYSRYYGAATDTWINAWEANKRDFKAFSGLIGLYATNFSGFDWMETFAAFQKGQISTGR